ncbi:MAG TPA: hypothetical protein VKP65_11840 [Rhodothermales bacterium]|nr:hypothetical protein [Rhodothermales bacterium]
MASFARSLMIVLLLVGASCSPEAAPVDDESGAETAPVAQPAPEPEPAPDPLYEIPAVDMRVAFADGLYGLYNQSVAPEAARRLEGSEIRAWLETLEEHDPRSVAWARRQLAEVLQQPYVVAFVMPGAVQESCASFKEALYVPIPERFQEGALNTDGIILKETCETGNLCLQCVGGRGEAPDGTKCSCVCTLGACPATDCVTC